MPSCALTLRNVTLRARDGADVRTLLDIPALDLPPCARVGIMGPSGSGKTSLLHILGGLRVPDTGEVNWGGVDIARLPEGARDAWRGRAIGFVFQDFRLFAELSACENVLVPVTFRHRAVPVALHAEALALLAELSVARPRQRAATLSRGEQQRVAVARALLFRPGILLADEPTASLDVENAHAVMDALHAYADARGATLCVVSHDALVLDRMTTLLRLERGRVLPESV